MSKEWKTEQFKKERLNECNEIAKHFSGTLISNQYTNASDKLEWKCSNPNHKSWLASYNHISRMKTWCPECS